MCNEACPGFHDFCAQHKCASFCLFCFWQEMCNEAQFWWPFFSRKERRWWCWWHCDRFLLGGVVFAQVAISLHPKYVCALPIPCHCICSQESWNFVRWGGFILTVLVTTSGNYLTHITERTWGGLVHELCSPLEIIHNESFSIDVQSWESSHWQVFHSVQKTQKNLNEKIAQLMQLLMMCLHSWDLRMGLETQMKPRRAWISHFIDPGARRSHISYSQHFGGVQHFLPFLLQLRNGHENIGCTPHWYQFFYYWKFQICVDGWVLSERGEP